MRSILITGGAGFIGSHLVNRLLTEGAWQVSVVDDFNDFYDPAIKRANVSVHQKNANFHLFETDIRDKQALEKVFNEVFGGAGDFQCIVHLAARAGVRPSLEQPLLYAETNIQGTLNLLELARASGVKQFVFGSSSSVYGMNARVPFSEDDPIRQPISPYAATKAAGELLCHTYSHLYDMRCVCLRFFTVYGPRQRPDLAIHKFARLISEGKPIPVFRRRHDTPRLHVHRRHHRGRSRSYRLHVERLRSNQPGRIPHGRAARVDFTVGKRARRDRENRSSTVATRRCATDLRRHYKGAPLTWLQSADSD